MTKKLEFSKILAIVIVSLFVLVFIGAMIIEWITGTSLKVYSDSLIPVLLIVLGFYFGKAGTENVFKITNDRYTIDSTTSTAVDACSTNANTDAEATQTSAEETDK